MKKTLSLIVIAAIAATNYSFAAPASKSKHFDRKSVKMVTIDTTTVAKDKEVVKKTVMAGGKSSMARKNRGGSNTIIRRG